MSLPNNNPNFLKQLLLGLILGFSLFVPQTSHGEVLASAEEPDQYVQVRLIANKTTVSGGEIIRIGLEQTIYPQWHTYWKNPGDSGTATSIDWQLPPEFNVSELEWPTPKKLPFGPLTNYGYEGNVVLLQNLTIPQNIGTMPFELQAQVNLLVCHEICIPETHPVSIIFNGNVPAEPQKILTAEALLPTTQNWLAEFNAKGDNFVIDIQEPTLNLQDIQKITLAPVEWGLLDNTQDAVFKASGSTLTISQKKGERAFSEVSNFPLNIILEMGDSTKKSYIVNATNKVSENVNSSPNAETESSIKLWQALAFALLGGLILNLMPCVFPVLSMKALSLVSLEGKQEKKARGYGLSYTAGVLLSFGLIAGILLALKAGGAQIGWGFQLQNPIVISLLIYLIFLIGLNLSGFFEFSGRLGNMGQKLTQKSGNQGAFFTGILATIVATPCTAPFMGAAMGFALTQPAYISLAVFLTLGFGLALPYLALCYIPALRSKLPKPGAWMETFRQILAFPMMITAAWLVWVLSQQVSDFSVFFILLSLIAITFILWLSKMGALQGGRKVLKTISILLAFLFIAFATLTIETEINAEQGTTTQQNEQNWQDFSPSHLKTMLDETNEPIFTNMTAAWCITCKVNEKIALKTTKIKALFAEQNIQYLKGDWTNKNDEITQYLNSFDRQGVPLYVFYGARDDQTGKRPDPIVLPQILTPSLVEKTILGQE